MHQRVLYAAGDWLPSFSCMQTTHLQVWLRHWEVGVSSHEASNAAGHIWSLGVLLFEMVLGHLPYPGKLKSGKLVKSAAELTEGECRGTYKLSSGTSCDTLSSYALPETGATRGLHAHSTCLSL